MLTLWNPINELDVLTREVDRFFSRSAEQPAVAFCPTVDIEEAEDRFILHADLPGLKESDIDVKVHEGTLCLSGKREEASEHKGEGYYRRERSHGSFSRSFRLGPAVDADKIQASYDKGVLTVVLPKKEEVKPRQIPVKGN